MSTALEDVKDGRWWETTTEKGRYEGLAEELFSRSFNLSVVVDGIMEDYHDWPCLNFDVEGFPSMRLFAHGSMKVGRPSEIFIHAICPYCGMSTATNQWAWWQQGITYGESDTIPRYEARLSVLSKVARVEAHTPYCGYRPRPPRQKRSWRFRRR